jgi:hypothetical protein
MLRFPSMTMFEGRAALQRYIVDEALRLAPEPIKFHFSRSIAQLDVAGRTLRLVPSAAGSSSGSGGSRGGGGGRVSKTSTGSGAPAVESDGSSSSSATAPDRTQYDLLVGADGANSCVRAALLEQVLSTGCGWHLV